MFGWELEEAVCFAQRGHHELAASPLAVDTHYPKHAAAESNLLDDIHAEKLIPSSLTNSLLFHQAIEIFCVVHITNIIVLHCEKNEIIGSNPGYPP